MRATEYFSKIFPSSFNSDSVKIWKQSICPQYHCFFEEKQMFHRALIFSFRDERTARPLVSYRSFSPVGVLFVLMRGVTLRGLLYPLVEWDVFRLPLRRTISDVALSSHRTSCDGSVNRFASVSAITSSALSDNGPYPHLKGNKSERLLSRDNAFS